MQGRGGDGEGEWLKMGEEEKRRVEGSVRGKGREEGLKLRECEKVGEEWKAREEVNQWKEETEGKGRGGGVQEKEESRSHRLLVRS